MAVSFRIETKGLGVPKAALKVIQYRLRHMTPALSRGGKYMESVLDKRFAAQGGASSFGGPYKVWARNKPSTIKQKGHRIVLVGGGPRRGKLRRSLRAIARGDSLKITYAGYGQFHMDGHKKGLFPKRPFAYPTKGDMDIIANYIVRYVIRGTP